MKEKLKNKKVIYGIMGVILMLLVVVAVSYAYWLLTKVQTKPNKITAGCIDISLTNEENEITLTNQYPMNDVDGMKLTPFTFTVINNCDTGVNYEIKLESIGTESESISPESLKVALNENIRLLSNTNISVPSIEDAYASNILVVDTLAGKASVSYSLRIWLAEDASLDEKNKSHISKISVTAGQEIGNSVNKGTLADHILEDNGGAHNIKTLTYDYDDGEPSVTSSSIRVYKTTAYWFGTKYIYDKDTKTYTLDGDKIYASIGDCQSGTKTCGKYTLFNSSESAKSTIMNVVQSYSTPSSNYIYVYYKTQKAENGFSAIPSDEASGLYKMLDDYGYSYFFRGNVDNNYVKFGIWDEKDTEVRGYYSETSEAYNVYESLEKCESATSYNVNCKEVQTDNAGKDMYWRIVRINGDGTVRLAYDGLQLLQNGTSHKASIGASAYSTNTNDAKYIGYTYDDNGTKTDSLVKSKIDAWYKQHLNTSYNKYIADSIFCADNSIYSTTYYDANKYVLETAEGAKYLTILYNATNRLKDNKKPVLTCEKQYRYTLNTDAGNGLMDYPVGLLSADEAAVAGNVNGLSYYKNYLYSGNNYWTSTPVSFSTKDDNTGMWIVKGEGSIGGSYLNSTHQIRPVINIKSDILFKGEGTIKSPYEMVME